MGLSKEIEVLPLRTILTFHLHHLTTRADDATDLITWGALSVLDDCGADCGMLLLAEVVEVLVLLAEVAVDELWQLDAIESA